MAVGTYIFDIDELIVDSKLYTQVFSNIIEKIKRNLKIGDEEVIQKVRQMNIKDNIFDLGRLCKELNAIEVYLYEIEKKIVVNLMLKEKLVFVFKGLKTKGKKVGVVSNLSPDAIKLYLDKYALSMFVDFSYSQSYAGFAKDTKQFYQKLIEHQNLVPSECTVVGKSILEDVTMPKSVGFKTYYISGSFDLTYVLNRE